MYLTDNEIDAELESKGMISMSERMMHGPLDKLMVHTGVVDNDTFFQWVEQQRREKLRMLAMHELNHHVLDKEILDFVEGQAYNLWEIHVTLKYLKEIQKW